MNTENYTPYGEEWEKEMMKLPKKELVKWLKKAFTGSKYTEISNITTEKEAFRFAEGIMNDFESGICEKETTVKLIGEYTFRLMNIFWDTMQKKIQTEPDFLERNFGENGG